MIVIRRYKESKDYETVKSWWETRGFTSPKEDMLNAEYGFLAEGADGPIAALFLYPIVGSKIAYHGWPSSDPGKSKVSRKLALGMLYDKIEAEAKELGYRYLWTESGVKPVEQALKIKGHEKADRNVNQYLKVLE